MKACYFSGVISKRYPTTQSRQGSLIKCTISSGPGDTDSINVFLVGPIADQSDVITEDDVLVLNNFHIENNSNSEYSNHSCQIIIDRMRSDAKVWIVHNPDDTNKKRDNVSTGSSIAGTSGSNQPQGQALGNTQRTQLTRQGSPRKKTPAYTYTQLRNLEKNSTINIYGVIKFLKPAQRTRGTDYMMLISLVDPSLDSFSHKLKCVIFAREKNYLPEQAKIGDIIRMHRLKISEFNDEPQGANAPGFSWLVFDNEEGGPLNPKYKSSQNYTITDQDLTMVVKVRKLKSLIKYFCD